jgi:hypothetical protein
VWAVVSGVLWSGWAPWHGGLWGHKAGWGLIRAGNRVRLPPLPPRPVWQSRYPMHFCPHPCSLMLHGLAVISGLGCGWLESPTQAGANGGVGGAGNGCVVLPAAFAPPRSSLFMDRACAPRRGVRVASCCLGRRFIALLWRFQRRWAATGCARSACSLPPFLSPPPPHTHTRSQRWPRLLGLRWLPCAIRFCWLDSVVFLFPTCCSCGFGLFRCLLCQPAVFFGFVCVAGCLSLVGAW